MKARTAVTVLVAGAALIAAGCGRTTDTMTTPNQQIVAVIHPQRSDMIRTIELPGDVVGFYETALHAKVTGYLRTINVDKGDQVKAGQVLAEIEVPELRSNLMKSQANLKIAQITYDRLKRVQQQDPRLVAQEDVDMAEAKYEEAKAAFGALQAMESYTEIVAPFNGVITGRFADPGALIEAGGDIGDDTTSALISPSATEGSGGHLKGGPILTIADINQLRVYVYVPEGSYPMVHDGTRAELRFDEFPGRVFTGKVTRIADSLDLATRTMLAEVDIDNPGRELYPRSYAHVTLDLMEHRDALEVPTPAVAEIGNSSQVMVVKNGRIVQRVVKTGIINRNYIEITSGLRGQSLVLGTFSNAFTPGQKVQYRMSKPKVMATANADN